MTTRVTVFCPIFNDSLYIDDLMKSVLGQTLRDFQFVILENGSSDETREKLLTYDDPRIRLVTSHINYRSETGASLLRDVDSTYIAIIFSDDMFLRSKLEESVGLLEKSGADACFSNCEFMRSDKTPLSPKEVPVSQFNGDISQMQPCEHLWHMVKRGNTLHPVAMVIRTDTFHDLGGFRGDLHQIGDMEFFSRLLLKKKVKFIKKPLQRIRIHADTHHRINESTVSEAMHARVRSERMNFLNNFRLPEALSIVDKIFLPEARGISITEDLRLWFLGQQFVHEFEPDYRIFGMSCLYDALKAHGPQIESRLTGVIGVPPGAYMHQLSARVYSNFGSDDAKGAEFSKAQLEIQSLRRELSLLREKSERVSSADLFVEDLDADTLDLFKQESYGSKSKRSLKDILKKRPLLPKTLPGFDADYYIEQNKDILSSGTEPLRHFLRFGWREGRNPSAVFSCRGYLQANPDVREAGLNPLLHFLEYGQKEGRHGWETV